jgi:hypothetical protein
LKKYESKNNMNLIQIIMIIIGILLLFNYSFSFLNSKSSLDLFFSLPLFVILEGIFLNETYLSKQFLIACLSIIIFQGIIWMFAYIYLPFNLSIKFYAQLGFVFIMLLILVGKRRKFLK